MLNTFDTHTLYDDKETSRIDSPGDEVTMLKKALTHKKSFPDQMQEAQLIIESKQMENYDDNKENNNKLNEANLKWKTLLPKLTQAVIGAESSLRTFQTNENRSLNKEGSQSIIDYTSFLLFN